MLAASGPGRKAGVAGGMTTRVRHVGAGAGEAEGMFVVPCVRVKKGDGGSGKPEMLVVDTAGAGCVGVEMIEGVM